MPSPLFLLAALALLSVFLVRVFWPPSGLWWRWRRGLLATERAQVEDALKHLHSCESLDRGASLESVAGSLGISGDRAAEILARLQREGLAAPAGDRSWTLTDDGRTYALRVIRTHRLWERYFSERTGLAPGEWHAQAELREHTTSSHQVQAMAELMGHPRFDPHGDPIPTPTGGMPPMLPGKALPGLEPGTVGEIVHVEDEPQAVYSQLVAEGLHPGMRVRVIEVTPQRVRFEADAEEHVLAPVVASNLTVRVVAKEEMPAPYDHLTECARGETAEVVGLSPALRGAERRRLIDLGILPGTAITVVRRGPSGDPTAYLVRGGVIALRSSQASQIRVRRQLAGELV
jgi:DtxR family Mn-dependent transcriptional regulator